MIFLFLGALSARYALYFPWSGVRFDCKHFSVLGQEISSHALPKKNAVKVAPQYNQAIHSSACPFPLFFRLVAKSLPQNLQPVFSS